MTHALLMKCVGVFSRMEEYGNFPGPLEKLIYKLRLLGMQIAFALYALAVALHAITLLSALLFG